MKASVIIERARSLADLQNSRAITYEDEKHSLNEGWKLIYNKLTENDDDYFTLDANYTNIGQYKLVDDTNTYIIPLPLDFYKLRTVSSRVNNKWEPVNKYPINMRNINTSMPLYRIKNKSLHIIFGQTPGDISITYYPPAQTLTLPDYSNEYNILLSNTAKVYNTLCVADVNTIYKCFGSTILRYNYNSDTSTVIYQGTGTTSNPVYYRNMIYFIEGGTLKALDLVSNVVTDIKIGAINYSIQNNIVYYTDGVDTFSNDMLGGNEQVVSNEDRYNVYFNEGYMYYIRSGSLYRDTDIVDVASYLSFPYYNKQGNVYHVEDGLWRENVDIGSQWNNRIIGYNWTKNKIEVYSTIQDSELEYPSNALFEIISYQAAADFKRKYEEASADLENKLIQMWDTFLHSMIRRDDGQPEKIQNAYNYIYNY